MEYDEGNQLLTIDLKLGGIKLQELAEFSDVKIIRLNNCENQIKLPTEFKSFKNLHSIYCYARLDYNYECPANVELFSQLRHLKLWSGCDLESIPKLLTIENLEIVICDPSKDTEVLIPKFPALKKLVLRGSVNENKILSSRICEFKELVDLSLISCGLSSLPKEIKLLKALKKIELNRLDFTQFPKELCEMSWLETISFHNHLIELPEKLSNLTNLKELNLSRVFNFGTTEPVEDLSGNTVKMNPIPTVLSKLSSLESLNLDFCGRKW